MYACVDIVKLAQHGLALRQWEREHLPTEDSQLGYEVFMKLAELVASNGAGQASLLKQVYLALPYSEKGIRLHLRRLEATGWITVQRTGDDARAAQVELSAGYWKLLNNYATRWPLQAVVVINGGSRCGIQPQGGHACAGSMGGRDDHQQGAPRK